MPDALEYRAPGGMVPVSVLRVLAETAMEHGTGRVCFTSSQCIRTPGISPARLRRLQKQLTLHEHGNGHNVLSSAPVAGLGQQWVRESTYTDLLSDNSLQRCGVPVSMADPQQQCLPVMHSSINFLASAREEQWRIAVCLPDVAPLYSPGLVRAKDVPVAAKRLAAIVQRRDAQAALRAGGMDDALGGLLTRDAAENHPPLERYRAASGMFTMTQPVGGWRAGMLMDLCLIAAARGMAALGITPWRTLLLPVGSAADRDAIEGLCFKNRYALRENAWRQWMLYDDPMEQHAEMLAGLLQKESPVNPGISLAVQHAGSIPPDVHFVVQPCREGFWSRQRFRLLAAEGVDIRAKNMRVIQEAPTLRTIAAAVLKHLEGRRAPEPAQHRSPAAPIPRLSAHACGECGTEYAEEYGDLLGGVAAGTAFSSLPDAWVCPCCGAPLTAYAAA